MNVWSFSISSFISLMTIVNPLITMPSFMGLLGHLEVKRRTALMLKACLIAFGIWLTFSLCGMMLLEGAGLTAAALRIAGGILLFKTGASMLSEGPADETASQKADPEGLVVFPLAFPLLSGPGSLCIIANMSHSIPSESWGLYSFALAIVIAVVALINFAALLAAPQILRLFGKSGIEIMKKLVGLFIAILATQLVVNGVVDVYHTSIAPKETANERS